MTSQTAQGQDFNTELQSTELGSFLAKNKVLIISLIVAFLAGIIATGIYNHFQKKNEKIAANAFYTFESTTLSDFSAGKADANKVVSEFDTVRKNHNYKNAVFASALVTFDTLVEKGNIEQAKSILTNIETSNSFQAYLYGIRKALILEESGDIDGAIKELNLLAANELKLMEGKVQLDLGRLYLKKNDKTSAKTSFEAVKKTKTQAVFKSAAEYYLNQL